MQLALNWLLLTARHPQEPKQLKEAVKQLYHKYCRDQALQAEEDADFEREVRGALKRDTNVLVMPPLATSSSNSSHNCAVCFMHCVSLKLVACC